MPTLNKNVIDFFKAAANPMSESLRKTKEQNIELSKAYVQGQMQEAGRMAYAQRQQILDVQRKYGITGAAAAAQMQQFELKHKEMLNKIANQSTLDWYKTVGANTQTLEKMNILEQSSRTQGLMKQIQQGTLTNVAGVRQFMDASNLDSTTLTDLDIQNMIENSSEIGNLKDLFTNRYADVNQNK